MKAIADGVEEALRAAKVRPAHVEGYERAEWVLMDYFTFIVHVFTPQTRAFYSLERLWGDAERIEVRRRGIDRGARGAKVPHDNSCGFRLEAEDHRSLLIHSSRPDLRSVRSAARYANARAGVRRMLGRDHDLHAAAL